MEVTDCGSKGSKVKFSREFPPECGISGSFLVGFSSNRKFNHYVRDWPLGCGPNTPKSAEITSDKLPGSVKTCGFDGDSTTWRRNVSAVKSKPQVVSKNDEVLLRNPHNSKGKDPKFNSFREEKSVKRADFDELRNTHKGKDLVIGNLKEKKGSIDREREQVLEMLRVFRERCKELSGKGIKRVDSTAYGELKSEGKIVNRSAMLIGSVPGVEIGDKFYYRLELVFVGLHKQTQGGIDTMNSGGVKLTTCIVANERHIDKMNDPNALVYIGEGGNLKRHEIGLPPDQELKGGNRALYNSMEFKKPVRVVRGLMSERSSNQRSLYVYDGLYEVRNCQQKKGPQGNMIFEFRLVRCGDQPQVSWQECRRHFY